MATLDAAALIRLDAVDSTNREALRRIEAGAPCTWFVPQASPRTARKRWIAGALKPAGSIGVDAGALKALRQGRSLLPAGVNVIEGDFERGDAVIVKDARGTEVGARHQRLFGRRRTPYHGLQKR